MHDMEIPAQKQYMHTMERLVAPLNKSATFFQAPCSIKLIFDSMEKYPRPRSEGAGNKTIVKWCLKNCE